MRRRGSIGEATSHIGFLGVRYRRWVIPAFVIFAFVTIVVFRLKPYPERDVDSIALNRLKSTNPVCNLDHGLGVGTRRTFILAHRGSSALRPENSAEAFQLAVHEGADGIECDVVVTRDLKLVCLHDYWLNATTNVEELFPGRLRTYAVNGVWRSDYFVIDFSLDELKTLGRKWIPPGGHRTAKRYRIATFEEFIQVAKNADRRVAIFPEIKNPDWVNAMPPLFQKITVEELVVQTLQAYGYHTASDSCVIHTFYVSSLNRLTQLTKLPFLVDIKYRQITKNFFSLLPKQTYGLNILKERLVGQGDNGTSLLDNPILLEVAHEKGLKVFVWTFNEMLLPYYQDNPFHELKHFIGLGIDGIVTDFPSRVFKAVHDTCNS